MRKYHGNELRKGRVSIIGQAYLLTAVTDKRAHQFLDWRCGRFLAHEFCRENNHGNVDSLAWVIMPDHFHWLMVLRQGFLSRVMLRVKAGSARNLNRFLGRQGQIWQRGYYDHALRKEENLRRTARYILANPVRAGLVNHISEYPLWDAVWL